MIINDGREPYTARVDKFNRLYTFAVTESAENWAVDRGKAWNLNTQDITLTSDTASSLLYFKNTDADYIVIPSIVWIASNSAGKDGVDNMLVEVVAQPTSVSYSSAIVPINRSIGVSAQPESYVAYKGAQGATSTGGDVVLSSRMNDASRLALPVLLELPQGASVALRVTPPSGNTSMKMQVAIPIYSVGIE